MLPATLLVFSIVLTIIAWYLSRNYLEEKSKVEFESNVNDIQSAIEVRMSAYEQVLRSGEAFFYASDTVTRTDWKNYVQSLRLQESYPGILGLGFTKRLLPAEVEGFTKKVRAEGFPDFKVWPEDPRDEYHSIVYLEPFAGRNLRAFGFDMYTQGKRRKAMERAGRTGKPALSKMVRLVQETTKDVQKGCLLYMPVYNKGMSIATEEERRAALDGFVYSPFRINDLMKGILGSEASAIEFELYDGTTVDTAHLFYDTHGYNSNKSKAVYSTERQLQVAGHDWTLVFTTRKPFITSSEANQPNMIAIAGILVNLLLLFILVKVHSLSRRHMLLAERFKAEKDRYEIVSESTNDIIWEWDIESNRVSFNKNYKRVLGYEIPTTEFSFKEWISHIYPNDRERVIDNIQAFVKKGNKLWRDEYRLLKADGSFIYILDRGRIIKGKSGNPERMVGSMINITERKQAEEAQLRFNEELEKTVQERTLELQRSNEDLERFAHVASHDLKEPVRKILTSVDWVRTKYKDILGDGVVLLDRLTKSAKRLNQMIDSILTYSTVNYESQGAEKVDLNIIIQNVTDDLELIITEKDAAVIADPLPVVEGSTVLLHQLFYNLINNSLKFSKPGMKPVVKIESKILGPGNTGMAEIAVMDNGIGFSESEAKKIFQSFFRLHSKDRYEGTGLGLALCKRIVERHGGNINASGSPDQGATFTVWLPLHQQDGMI